MRERLLYWFLITFPGSGLLLLFVIGSAEPATRQHEGTELMIKAVVTCIVFAVAAWGLVCWLGIGNVWFPRRPSRKEELSAYIQSGYRIAQRQGLTTLPEGYEKWLEEYERNYGPWIRSS